MIKENNRTIAEFKKEKKKVPQEALTGSMIPPQSPPHYCGGIVWRPNNYRRQIKIKPSSKVPSEIKVGRNTNTFISSGNNLIYLKNNEKPNITLQLGKNKLTAIWSQERRGKNKMTFFIEADSMDLLEQRLEQKKEEIRLQLDQALLKFARDNQIMLPLSQPIWTRYEDWIKGEEFIDSIPVDMIIHDTHFKKVYGHGIEFKNKGLNDAPIAKLKTFIKNRSLEDKLPQIESAIVTLAESHIQLNENLLPIMRELQLQLKLHLTAINGINDSFKRFNNLLSQKSLECWLR